MYCRAEQVQPGQVQVETGAPQVNTNGRVTAFSASGLQAGTMSLGSEMMPANRNRSQTIEYHSTHKAILLSRFEPTSDLGLKGLAPTGVPFAVNDLKFGIRRQIVQRDELDWVKFQACVSVLTPAFSWQPPIAGPASRVSQSQRTPLRPPTEGRVDLVPCRGLETRHLGRCLSWRHGLADSEEVVWEIRARCELIRAVGSASCNGTLRRRCALGVSTERLLKVQTIPEGRCMRCASLACAQSCGRGSPWFKTCPGSHSHRSQR
jgi:hypothetical protein